jgi:hypothetical protein
MFWPGNVYRLFKFSLQFQIRDDAAGKRERADERGEQHRIVMAAPTVMKHGDVQSRDLYRLRPFRNSKLATSAAAPPPRPLNSATICGIAVIFTEYAPIAPMIRPMTDADDDERVIEAPALRPDVFAVGLCSARAPMNMPAAATRLPDAARFSANSESLMPRMNRTETPMKM